MVALLEMERERERERDSDREKERERERDNIILQTVLALRGPGGEMNSL
jgi:hypothetical protein